jgi:hypothetical protein
MTRSHYLGSVRDECEPDLRPIPKFTAIFIALSPAARDRIAAVAPAFA